MFLQQLKTPNQSIIIAVTPIIRLI